MPLLTISKLEFSPNWGTLGLALYLSKAQTHSTSHDQLSHPLLWTGLTIQMWRAKQARQERCSYSCELWNHKQSKGKSGLEWFRAESGSFSYKSKVYSFTLGDYEQPRITVQRYQTQPEDTVPKHCPTDWRSGWMWQKSQWM